MSNAIDTERQPADHGHPILCQPPRQALSDTFSIAGSVAGTDHSYSELVRRRKSSLHIQERRRLVYLAQQPGIVRRLPGQHMDLQALQALHLCLQINARPCVKQLFNSGLI